MIVENVVVVIAAGQRKLTKGFIDAFPHGDSRSEIQRRALHRGQLAGWDERLVNRCVAGSIQRPAHAYQVIRPPAKVKPAPTEQKMILSPGSNIPSSAAQPKAIDTDAAEVFAAILV